MEKAVYGKNVFLGRIFFYLRTSCFTWDYFVIQVTFVIDFMPIFVEHLSSSFFLHLFFFYFLFRQVFTLWMCIEHKSTSHYHSVMILETEMAPWIALHLISHYKRLGKCFIFRLYNNFLTSLRTRVASYITTLPLLRVFRATFNTDYLPSLIPVHI